MVRVTDEDEFALLDEEADAFGLPHNTQPVGRHAIATRSTGLSALLWGESSPQLVLLHGAGLNAHTWDATVLALGRPALALDLPGHGDSAWRPDADYRAATSAGPVADAIEQLAPQAPVVVGHSLGGLTALALSADRPDLIRRLVVVDVTPGLVLGEGNPVRDFLAGADSFASRDEIVDRAASFGIGTSRAALVRGVRLNTRVRDDGRVVFKHHLGNLGDAPSVLDGDLSPLWPAAEALDVPVLLVRASRGFLTDALVDDFVDRVPGARAATIESGHNVQEDAPVELARIVADFASE